MHVIINVVLHIPLHLHDMNFDCAVKNQAFPCEYFKTLSQFRTFTHLDKCCSISTPKPNPKTNPSNPNPNLGSRLGLVVGLCFGVEILQRLSKCVKVLNCDRVWKYADRRDRK